MRDLPVKLISSTVMDGSRCLHDGLEGAECLGLEGAD